VYLGRIQCLWRETTCVADWDSDSHLSTQLSLLTVPASQARLQLEARGAVPTTTANDDDVQVRCGLWHWHMRVVARRRSFNVMPGCVVYCRICSSILLNILPYIYIYILIYMWSTRTLFHPEQKNERCPDMSKDGKSTHWRIIKVLFGTSGVS
jgi:hypothetical protein